MVLVLTLAQINAMMAPISDRETMLQSVPDLGLTTPPLAVAVLLPTAASVAHMRYHKRSDPNDMVPQVVVLPAVYYAIFIGRAPTKPPHKMISSMEELKEEIRSANIGPESLRLLEPMVRLMIEEGCVIGSQSELNARCLVLAGTGHAINPGATFEAAADGQHQWHLGHLAGEEQWQKAAAFLVQEMAGGRPSLTQLASGQEIVRKISISPEPPVASPEGTPTVPAVVVVPGGVPARGARAQVLENLGQIKTELDQLRKEKERSDKDFASSRMETEALRAQHEKLKADYKEVVKVVRSVEAKDELIEELNKKVEQLEGVLVDFKTNSAALMNGLIARAEAAEEASTKQGGADMGVDKAVVEGKVNQILKQQAEACLKSLLSEIKRVSSGGFNYFKGLSHSDFAGVVVEPLAAYYKAVKDQVGNLSDKERELITVSSFTHESWAPLLGVIASRVPRFGSAGKGFTQDVFSYAKHMAGASEDVCLSCGVEVRQDMPRHPPLREGLEWVDPKSCKVQPCTICEDLGNSLRMKLGRSHVEGLCPLGKDYRNLAKFAQWLKVWRPTTAPRGVVKQEVAGGFASCSLDFGLGGQKRKRDECK